MQGLLNLLTGVSLALAVMVLVSVRRQHIRVEYSVSWLGAALTLLLVSRSQALMGRLAETLNIAEPAVALLVIVGCLFVLVLYQFSLVISGLKDANIALAQRVAILEYHLRAADEQKTTQYR